MTGKTMIGAGELTHPEPEPEDDLGRDALDRIHALAAARDILGNESKGPFGGSSRPSLVDLIDLADYILTGDKPR